MSPGDIFDLIIKGGPAGIAAIALFAWWAERKDKNKLVQQVVELATASVAAQVENKSLLNILVSRERRD